jgi:hypothetical protein
VARPIFIFCFVVRGNASNCEKDPQGACQDATGLLQSKVRVDAKSVSDARNIPTMAFTFPMHDFKGGVLLEMPDAAQTTQWCFTITTANATDAESIEANGKEHILQEANATDAHHNLLYVAATNGVEPGTYCCPGRAPRAAELVKTECGKSHDNSFASMMKATKIVEASIHDNLGESAVLDAAKQIGQLARQSGEDTMFLVDDKIYDAVLMELGSHEASKQVHVKFGVSCCWDISCPFCWIWHS